MIQQLENLKKFPWISRRLAEKTLSLHGWFYDIGGGHISIYDASIGEIVPFNVGLKAATINTRNQCISEIVKNHLSTKLNPQSAEKYREMRTCLAQLEKNLESLWPEIAEQIEEKLWQKFGEKYPIFAAKSDADFMMFMNEGKQIKWQGIEEFTRQLKGSTGYRAHCEERAQHRLFKAQKAENDRETVLNHCEFNFN